MFQGMEYVYEVYKERSFSKAAQNLFISQPSLSANVKRVEARIGYPIFDRSTKPLGLTELGERYIRSVEQILSVESGFSDYVNDCGELKTGNLILGGSNLFSSWILPPMMARFARKYPSVKLVLMEERTARLQEHLLAGDVDIMIDYGLAGEEAFEKKLFRTERLVLAVPRAFEINRRMEAYRIRPEWIRSGYYLQDEILPVPLDAFRGEPFVLLKPDNDTRKHAMKICQAHGFTPKILLELDQQMTAYNVTCSGMGISVIGDTLVQKVPENPGVVYYKLPKALSERGLYFYWKRGRYVSRAMEEFLQLAQIF
ncbi:MAG: LysR family transcriptional regulator [Lachnospiraceae bacterium]|nr:LysR family transcriptional regulator [Lachnospiraceae bacterium]